MVTASGGRATVLQVLALLAVTTCTPLAAGTPLRGRALMPVATDNSFTWHGGDGSYRFGMRGEDQWRVETRDRHGSVLGQYHYRTSDGGKVQVKFSAGPKTNDFGANERALLALTGRVGEGGVLLFDTATTSVSGQPLSSGPPSSQPQPQEQAFVNRVNPEQPVGTAENDVRVQMFDRTQTKLSPEAAIANIVQREGVMPYGALLMVSTGDFQPLAPGIDELELNAIVTNVQPRT